VVWKQDHVSCFNNRDVETAVSQALVDARVTVYSGYILAQWDLVFADDEDQPGEVTSVSFTSDSTPLTLSCVVSACCFQLCNDQVAKVLKIYTVNHKKT